MPTVIILDRSNKHFCRFLELLKNQQEVRLKDVLSFVSRCSYYVIIVRRLFALNKILREIKPGLYLAEPTLSATDKAVYTTLRRCDDIEIESRKDFFILRSKHEKAQDHTNQGHS